MVSFSARDVFAAQRVIAQAFFRRLEQPSEMTLMMLRLSDKARRDSPLSLQSILDQLDEEEYLFQALQMVVDTVPPDEIERVLRREMNSINQRTMKSVAVLRRASDVAPAMGLIGTLVGLVQMLGNLSTPEAIGPGMAVALLTTFYGAIMANVFFAPIASKLERNSEELMLLHNIVLIAAVSISRQENPPPAGDLVEHPAAAGGPGQPVRLTRLARPAGRRRSSPCHRRCAAPAHRGNPM